GLAELVKAWVGPVHEDGGDLGFEVAGEDLHETGLVAAQPVRNGGHPTPGEPGLLLEETVKADRVDREDEGVFQGHAVVGRRDPEEDPDVAHRVAGPKDLEHDPAAIEIAGQFDCTTADDPDARGCLPHPEDGRSRWIMLLAYQ